MVRNRSFVARGLYLYDQKLIFYALEGKEFRFETHLASCGCPSVS